MLIEAVGRKLHDKHRLCFQKLRCAAKHVDLKSIHVQLYKLNAIYPGLAKNGVQFT